MILLLGGSGYIGRAFAVALREKEADFRVLSRQELDYTSFPILRACLALWERRAPFGTYNLTNPGFVTARQVVAVIQRTLQPNRQFDFWSGDQEFYTHAAKTPRSNCVLDGLKLRRAGIELRPAQEAVELALNMWRKT